MTEIPRVWGRLGFHQRVKRMDDSMAGVVLAAGAGSRLVPLTRLRPKALCPVDTRPLLDHALDRLRAGLDRGGAGGDWAGAAPAGGDGVLARVAVNLHHGAGLVDAHLPAPVHRSVEAPVALGTAGALGALRSWLDGRHALVTNADAWFTPGLDVDRFVASWDGERVRLLCVRAPGRGDFGNLRYCGVALLPWSAIEPLAAEPSGLYEVSWRHQAAAGRLDLVVHQGTFVDCAAPADYLAANLLASGGRSVVDGSAVIGDGAEIVRSVVWDASEVVAGEVLVDAVRAGPLTVLVR